MNGWADPDEATKGPDEPRICVEGCPTGYDTLRTTPLTCQINEDDRDNNVVVIDFNIPSDKPDNGGTVPDDEADIDIDVCQEKLENGKCGDSGGGTSG
jgi:hypothetical protein